MSSLLSRHKNSLHHDMIEPIDDTEEFVRLRSPQSDKGHLGILTPMRNDANGSEETFDACLGHILQEERELRERELALAREKEYLAHKLKQQASLLFCDQKEEIRSASITSSIKHSSWQTDTNRLQHDSVEYRLPYVSDGMNRISAYVSGNCSGGKGNDSGVHTRAGYGISLRGVSPNAPSLHSLPPVMRVQPLYSPHPPDGVALRVQQEQLLSLQQQVSRANAGVETDPATEEPTGGKPLTIERDETYSKQIPTSRHTDLSASSLSPLGESETSSVAAAEARISRNERDNTKKFGNAAKSKDEMKLGNETLGKVLVDDVSMQSVKTGELGGKGSLQQHEQGENGERTVLFNDKIVIPQPQLNETTVEGSQTSHAILSPVPHLRNAAKGVIVFSSTPVHAHMISVPPRSADHTGDVNVHATAPVPIINEYPENNTNNSRSKQKSDITSYKNIGGNQHLSTQQGVNYEPFGPSFTAPRTAEWYIPTSRVLEPSEFKNLLRGDWMSTPGSVNLEVYPMERMVEVPMNSPSVSKEVYFAPISPLEARQDSTLDATDYVEEFPRPPDLPVPDMPPPGEQQKAKGRSGCCCSWLPRFYFSRHFPFVRCGKAREKVV